MLAEKISITLPAHLNQFASDYQRDHHLRSKSEVIAEGLKLLEKMYLEARYREMAEDFKKNPALQMEYDIWDQVSGDGLDDEAW